MDKNKKLLGNKAILFKVIKEEEDTGSSNNHNKNVNSNSNTAAKKGRNKVNISDNKPEVAKNKDKVNNNQIQQNLKNLNTSNINQSQNKILIPLPDHEKDPIEIVSDAFNWKDTANITFDRIIYKYATLDKSFNYLTDLDKKEFRFKLFFCDDPNVHHYTDSDVKNLNAQYFEKKHKGKLRRIFIQVIDKRQISENQKVEELNKNNILLKFKKELDEILDAAGYAGRAEKTIVEDFFREFPQEWDLFEKIAIKLILEKYNYSDMNSYIYLYLYDNLRKLKDPKTIDHLRTKLKENCHFDKDLTLFSREMMRYYNKRQEKIKYSLIPGCKVYKDVKWTEENSLVEILLTALIHYKFEGFREVDLTQHYISDFISMVLCGIKWSSTVEKLIMNSNKMGEEGMWQLGRVLLYNKKLVDVDISLNLLTDEAIRALNRGLLEGFNQTNNNSQQPNSYENNSLQSNNINHNTQSSNPAQNQIYSYSFRKLNLSNNTTLTHECGNHIAKILELSPQLKFLNLSKNSIEDKGFQPILKTYANLMNERKTNLETLILYSTKFGAESLTSLSNIIKNDKCTLKSITLSENKFEHRAAVEFFNSLAINTSIEELILINCDIGNEMAEKIYQMLTKNHTLINLNLYNNRIDDPKIFKEILKFFSNLPEKTTHVGSTPITSTADHLDKKFNLLCEDDWEKLVNFDDLYNLNDTNKSTSNSAPKPNESNLNSQSNHGNNFSLPQTPAKKSLKYLDLSKNKCKLAIDNEIIEIVDNLELDSLDISQNFDFPTPDESLSKKFKEAITRIQDRTKIIY